MIDAARRGSRTLALAGAVRERLGRVAGGSRLRARVARVRGYFSASVDDADAVDGTADADAVDGTDVADGVDAVDGTDVADGVDAVDGDAVDGTDVADDGDTTDALADSSIHPETEDAPASSRGGLARATGGSRLVAALGGSVAGRAVARVDATARLTGAVEGARTARLGARLRAFATASWLYRWLTSEPEPDVIVIDLRETRSVGPAIAATERVGRTLAAGLPTSWLGDRLRRLALAVRERPIRIASLAALGALAATLPLVVAAGTPALAVAYLAGAGLAALGTRSRRSLAELRETRAWALLTAAFEPPEPPEPVHDDRTVGGTRTHDAHRNDDGTSHRDEDEADDGTDHGTDHRDEDEADDGADDGADHENDDGTDDGADHENDDGTDDGTDDGADHENDDDRG